MSWSRSISVLILAALMAVVCLTTGEGQDQVAKGLGAGQETGHEIVPGRIAVMPIMPASEVNPTAPRCPVCGAAIKAGRVEGDGAEVITSLVYNELKRTTHYDLVPPSGAEGAYQKVLQQTLLGNPVSHLQAVGRMLGAEAVLGGIVYRYRERRGTSYSAQDPASVGFELHLVRTADGKVVWRGQYDRTQQTVTSNLFDIGRALKGGLKWLTAEQLAAQGVDEALNSFPPGKVPGGPGSPPE